MLRPIYFTFEHANTLISIIAPSLVEWVWSFVFKEIIFFFQNKYFFTFFFKYIHVIVPMLVPKNSTLEHENIFLSVIWMSLMERDLRFLFKESIFFCQKKVIFLIYLRHIHIMIPTLIPNNSTLENSNTFLNIIWLSLIERVLYFLFKKQSISFQKNVFFPIHANLFVKRLFIIAMLRPIYFTFERANTLISIISPLLVEWVWSLVFKERIFIFKRK